MALRAILFDKDGTLIDFDATWGPAAYEVMRALAGADEEAFAALVRVSEYIVPERRFLPTSPLVAGSSASYGPLWAQALKRRPSPAFYREMDELFGYWGLRSLAPIGRPADLADRLVRHGFRLGIATNDSCAGTEASLAPHAPVLACFDFLAGADSGYGAKPGPGMALAFCAATGLAPREVAVVGDAVHDLAMGRAAGVGLTVGVLSGTSGREDLAALADIVVASVADLPALPALGQA